MAEPNYVVRVACSDDDVRQDALGIAIEQLCNELGPRDLTDVAMMPLATEGVASGTRPSVAVVLWSDNISGSAMEAVQKHREEGTTVITVVESTSSMAELPGALSALNAVEWNDDPTAIARLCLRELGLHESSRGVFISHRRSDGIVAAEQLYEAFAKAGWRPFVDRFDIEVGAHVQHRIDEALEDCAFLLLLETPSASSSPWVQHEVLYALDRHLGIAVVSIDDAPEFPIATDLRRHTLEGETSRDGTHIVLGEHAIQEIVAVVERDHAIALARRRRQLLVSAMAAASAAGLRVEAVPGWRLHVEDESGRELVGVLPNLPTPKDLYDIDCSRDDGDGAVLVHAAHVLEKERDSVLRWVLGDRPIDLVPNNAIGARWQGKRATR